MLTNAGIVLIVLGLLLHFIPRLLALRAAVNPEKLERDAGSEPLL